MPLVNMQDMLTHAYRHGYAVGAFDVDHFVAFAHRQVHGLTDLGAQPFHDRFGLAQ